MTSNNKNDEEGYKVLPTAQILEEPAKSSKKILCSDSGTGFDLHGNEIELPLAPNTQMQTLTTAPNEDDLEEITSDLSIANPQSKVYSNSFTESTIKDHERQMEMNYLKSKGHGTMITPLELLSTLKLDIFNESTEERDTHTADAIATKTNLLDQLAVVSALDKLFCTFPLPLGMAAIDFARAHPYNPDPNLDYDNENPRKTKSFWHRIIHGFHRRISFLLPTPLKKAKIPKINPTPTEEEKTVETLNDPGTVFEEVDLN